MQKVRVLVVEDSATVRQHLTATFARDPGFEVVGEAPDGSQAIDLCQALRPNLITMDMMMPVMTGLSATEYIMAHFPTPILIVSASTNRGELFKTYDALAAGAVDVVEKMRGDEPEGAWERNLLARARLVAKIKVITHPRARLTGVTAVPRPAGFEQPRTPIQGLFKPQLVAIGASTGGPGAIVKILRDLPRGFPLPILLALHINEPFSAAFADWLDAQTSIRVSYAKDGDVLSAAAGRVLMAPAGRHLVVKGGRLRLTDDPERHACRPSIDVLFESIAMDRGASTAAFLLTGMGRDGAAGLLQIRRAGGFTVAQDEATSVIFGMPREAILLDAAERVLPLGEMGPTIATAAQSGVRR